MNAESDNTNRPAPPDDPLGVILGEHLRGALDGQVGRSAAAFRQELRRPTRWRAWAGMAGGLAAMVAVGWVLAAHWPPGTSGRARDPGAWVDAGSASRPNGLSATAPGTAESLAGPAATPADRPALLRAAAWSPVVDEGLAVIDDRPVRLYSRQVVQEVEWYDAGRNAVVRTTVPRQQIFCVGMRTE